MKKKVLFVFLAIVLLISISQTLGIDDDDRERIEDAYWCLDSKVGDCSSLQNVDELVHSFLAIGECKDQLLAKRSDEGCWPSGNCNIKDTAQAVIAINEKYRDVVDSDVIIEYGLWWLLGKEAVPTDLDWLLQIHSMEATTCTVSWDDGAKSDKVEVKDNYKLEITDTKDCFDLYTPGNYWLKIKPQCMHKKFEITCEKAFITNLLYTKDGSTIFVSPETHDSSGGNQYPTREKISSLCFGQGGVCNYEGTLWAALAIALAGDTAEYTLDHEPYLPYIMANAEGRNLDYFPEAFLTYLGRSEYKSKIEKRQTLIRLSQGYWEGHNGKYFDTALVLFLRSVGSESENKARKWLLEDLKDNDVGGCWDSNYMVRDTAFILHSLWENMDAFECYVDGERDRCPLGEICEDKRCIEGCAEDEGCPRGEICQPNKCIKGCRVDDDCSGDLICTDDWRCVEPPECTVATEKENCSLEHICGKDDLCVEGCKDDTYCRTNQGRICDNTDKLCVYGCRNDTGCDDDEICEGNECIEGCRDDRGERGCEDRYICENKECVLGCRIDDHCGEGKICNEDKECVKGCRNDEGCKLGYVCSANLTCVEGCRGDDECDDGKICEKGGCIDGCRTDTNCPSGQVCSPAKQCVDCITKEHCTKREWCVGNDCIPLNWECAKDDHCMSESKPFCEDHMCVECVYKVNCPGGYCSKNNTCVECEVDGQCEEGYECVKNKCQKRPECVQDRDCKRENEICVEGYCISDSGECVYDFECVTLYGEGFICNNETNTCVPEQECYFNSDCNTERPGYICVNGSCVLGEDDECEFNSDCDDYGYDFICVHGECVPEDEEEDCEDDGGFFCRSSVDCRDDNGNIYDEYYCPGATRCCSVGEQPTTCSDEDGIICTSSQVCSGGGTVDTDDLRYGETCCVGGTCKARAEASECELAGGVCIYECYSNEEAVSKDCDDPSDLCCMEKTTECSSDSECEEDEECNEYGRCVTKEKPSLLWVWILLILIVLAVLGIVFREKLRPLFFRIKSMFGKERKPPRRPGLPPPSGPPVMARRPMHRRILHPQRGPPRGPPGRPPAKKPPAKPKSELDDVLKKLKDIGK
jgi:hypothetical protein